LVQRIETAQAEAIDISSNGKRAVIDDVILPLVGLPEGENPSGKIRFLRLSDDTCELLYAVREVDDAVELSAALKSVDDDPLVEAVTLVDGQTVALVDGHELFARYGEPPEAIAKPTCHLPDDDWARTILGPLVNAAGYDVVSGEDEEGDVMIVLDDTDETAPASKGECIRLRSQPEPSDNDGSIYRYDRDGLVNALRRARAGGVR